MEKCEHEKVIAELTDKNTKLDAEAKDLKTKATELTEKNTKLEAELKEHKTKAAELTETHKKLDAELKELKAKPPTPVAPSDVMVAVQAELKAAKAEYEALKAWKVAAEDADHMRRVQDVVDLRIKNGVLDAKNVQAAVDSLKKLPNDALDAMKADLEAVKGKFDSLPSGPKARLIPSVAARFDPMQPTVGDLVGKKPGDK
jgi:chromosome segregation ATPase